MKMPGEQILEMADRVRALMARRLGARGATLTEALDSRGNRLPGKVRAAVQALANAETIAHAPKLSRQADLAALHRHQDIALRYLAPLGRRGRVIAGLRSISATVVLGLILLTVLILWLLVRQGYLGP